jgi:uncharacterized membrane protein YfcA
MEWWWCPVLLVVGCVAGFLNVLAGGGSLLTMPVMVFLGMPGQAANGTNRVAILVQSISATCGFLRQGFSDFRLSLSLAACALPGTIVGAFLGTQLGGVWFNRVLAGVMLAVMGLMLSKGRKRRGDDKIEPPGAEAGDVAEEPDAMVRPSRRRLVAAHLLMVLVGFYGGIIQAGVGFVIMAVLHRVLRLDLVRVNMHKVFIIGVYTPVALGVFACHGDVIWAAGLSLAVGNAIGGWIGSVFAVKKGERLIRIVLNVTLLVMVVKLLLTGE